MTDVERIEQRLSAVERTLTGEIDIDAERLQEVLALSAEVETLESRIDGLEERIADLEGDVQSVGGYLSEVDSVNEDVERQALSAVATVDRLEERVDELEESVHRIDPQAERDLEDAVAASVDGVEIGGSSASEESTSDATERDYARRVLDRLSPRNDGDGDGEATDTDGEGSGTADEGSPDDGGSAEGTGAPAENGQDRSGDGATDGVGTPASRRTAKQERVDELFEGADADDDEDEGGVLSDLRDRFS